MIQSLQKFSQSRIAKVFLAIVALSFLAFFGGGNWFRPHDPNAIVATVGDLHISRTEFAEKIQQYAQRVAAQSGKSITPEDIFKTDVPQMILGGLIQDLLLNLEAKHLGITVSDEVLRDQIHSMKAFQNDKGEFNREHFAQILRVNGMSEDAFIADLRQELVREQLANAIMVGTYLPEEMVSPLFDAQYQYRQASLLEIPLKSMAPPPPPSKQVLEVFYKEHQKAFKTPELRTMSFFVIDPSLMSKDITATDEELKATYETKLESFGNKSFEDAKPLVLAEVQKEKSLEKIYEITQELDDKIAGGATFEELVPTIKGAQLIKLTEVDQKGQDRMGVFSPQLEGQKTLAPELLKAGFDLEEGTDSPFTQMTNGSYFTARVDKVIPAAFQPFEEIQSRVEKIWAENEQFRAAYEKAKQYVTDFNKGGRSASLMRLLPNLSLSEPSPTIADDIKNLVFSLHVGQAGLTPTPEGFAVVVVNKVIPPTAQVKEKNMDKFKEILLQHYQNDILTAYVKALEVRYKVNTNPAAMKSLYKQ
jgi:peptidyl-prolyl cis-trans isomerase D